MEGYLGVIEALGFSFVPRNFGACFGSLISINQNAALFSLLGTAFGGDGRTTFGLPDLRGRVPMGFGTGPGLSPRTRGQRVGFEEVTLLPTNLPSHTHAHSYSDPSGGTGSIASLHVAGQGGKKQLPDNGDFIAAPGNSFGQPQDNLFLAPTDVTTTVAVGGVSGGGGGFENDNFSIFTAGNSTPFPVVQPSTVVNFCICMQGEFPSRS